MTITQGHFERAARKSARNALLRNAVFIAVMAASATIWATESRADPDAPKVLAVEGAVVCFCLWRIVVAIGRLRDVTKHPYFLDFSACGDPRALAKEVEDAVASGAAICEGDAIVTDRFYVQLGLSHAVAALDDLAWIYIKQTKVKVHFIPIGTIREIELFTFSKSHRWVSMTLTVDEKILSTLTQRAKKARFGWSDENEKWWKGTRVSLEEKEKRVLVA